MDETEYQIKKAFDFKNLFQSVTGERVIKLLSERFHVDQTTFVNDDDGLGISTEATLFREGQRSVVLFIKGMIDLDVEAIRNEAAEIEADKNKPDDLAT